VVLRRGDERILRRRVGPTVAAARTTPDAVSGRIECTAVPSVVRRLRVPLLGVTRLAIPGLMFEIEATAAV